MNLKHLLLLALAAGSVAGCKSNKGIAKTEVKDAGYEAAVASLGSNALDFETLEAKARCRYDDNEKRLNFRLNIRVRKDEKIWISGSMLGIEGVRALITPDTVKVLNRLQRKYYVKPIEYVSDLTGLPVNFEGLQNLLTNSGIFFDANSSKYENKNGIVELVSEFEQLVNVLWLDESTLLMDRQMLLDEVNSRNMELAYHDYRTVKGKPFAFEQDIQVTGDKEAYIDLDFNSVEVNTNPSFSFNVNRNYEVID